jgi:protein-L-isoaspartate(D-aspartate) O-methyltransferase
MNLAWMLPLVLMLEGRAPASADDQSEARRHMVAEQLVRRGIAHPQVLAAMEAVPRHEFIPEDMRREAYDDCAVPIGSGQTISQPYIVAFMTEQLALKAGDRVLEIGTGSGYQAAVLSRLAGEVYSIEILESLARRAAKDLARLGFDKVKLRIGDGYAGWPEAAPFDVIIVTCAPDHVPEPLSQQLKEGGRMIIPVGNRLGQDLYLLEKRQGTMERRDVLPVRFVPMTGRAAGKP